MKEKLKPMFKWSGGKSRELKMINSLMPKVTGKIIEPFIGGGAFFLSIGLPSIINDNDPEIVNFYEVVKNKTLFTQLLSSVEKLKLMGLDPMMSKDQCKNTPGNLCYEYYVARDYLNSSNPSNDPLKWAYSFIVVRQMCFSGMYRKAKGKFNVPFGWYKKFSTNLSIDHHEFLQKCDINLGSFEQIITDDLTEDDFIFLDPPYLNRAGYNDVSGSLSTDLHVKLLQCLKNTKAKWMIVHCDDPFYRDNYKNYQIIDKNFAYSQNFRGRESSTNKVSHLYIRNYDL